MTTDAAAPAPERTVRRRPGRAAVIVGAVALALVAAGLVAIPLGGWDTVELQSAVVPEIAVGDTFTSNRVAIRVEEAWVGGVMPDDYDTPDDGMTYVVVRAHVRNVWRDPDTGASSVLTFDALDGLPAVKRNAMVRLAADGTFSSQLPPGVESEVLLRWEVPAASVAAGQPIAFGMIDARPDRALLFSGTAWRDPHVVVQATLVPRPSEELVYPWDS